MKHEDRIAETDALPRCIEPDRDLWPGIAARIQERKLVRPEFAAAPRPAAPWRRAGLLALAAMLLVTVSSAITAYLVRRPPSAGDLSQIPASGGAVAASLDTVALDEFEPAEAEYERVTAELLAALDARRDELAPETVRIVESNLRLIDEAIHTARSALERDPANAGLALKLNDIYRKRLDFLRQINRL